MALFGQMTPKIPFFFKRFFISNSEHSDEDWIRADPVHLEADHQRVFMRGCVGVPLSKERQTALLNRLNNFLKEDSLILIILSDTEWILKRHPGARRFAHVTYLSPADCLHQDITSFLPEGLEKAYWRRLFTECQMIMQDENNNSLWFWK